jgi:serine/threonine protein kinase
VSLEDFEFYEKLGSGSYGQVYRTKFKLNEEIYALKKLDKDFITKVNQFSALIRSIELENEELAERKRYPNER